MTPQDLMAGLAQLSGARVVGPLPMGVPRVHTDTRTLQDNCHDLPINVKYFPL